MLTENEPGHILGIDAAQIAQHLVEARGIQERPRSEDPVYRIVVFLLEIVRQNIERVRYDDQDGFPRVPGNVRHDPIHHLDVPLQQNAPVVFTLDNTWPRRHHDDLRIRTVRIVANPDARIGAVLKCGRMTGIQDRSQCLVPVSVDHHDLIDDAQTQNRIQNRISNLSCSDDHELARLHRHLCSSSSDSQITSSQPVL